MGALGPAEILAAAGSLILLLLTGFGYVLSFIFRSLVSGLAEQRKAVSDLKDTLPRDYAQRREVDGLEQRLTSEIRRLQDTLERGLDRIYDALDTKADK